MAKYFSGNLISMELGIAFKHWKALQESDYTFGSVFSVESSRGSCRSFLAECSKKNERYHIPLL